MRCSDERDFSGAGARSRAISAGDMPWVYLARCADGTLYAGATGHARPGDRVAVHNAGRGSKYCRARLPVVLVWAEYCPTLPDALRREWAVKRMSREEKLKLVEREGLDGMVERQ
jgi:putative endonuclease